MVATSSTELGWGEEGMVEGGGGGGESCGLGQLGDEGLDEDEFLRAVCGTAGLSSSSLCLETEACLDEDDEDDDEEDDDEEDDDDEEEDDEDEDDEEEDDDRFRSKERSVSDVRPWASTDVTELLALVSGRTGPRALPLPLPRPLPPPRPRVPNVSP